MKTLLKRFLDPAFGALPKSEIELLLLGALEEVGAISAEPGVYELVSKLRVTRTKARNLIYERELRRLTPAELDSRVRNLLKRPIIQKSGDQFVLEVENPLISDHLRSKIQDLGHVSDGSFSPSIVKLPLDAMVALIEFYIPKDQRDPVKAALVSAGAPDTSFKGVLKAVLKKVAGKVASDTGEALLKNASEYISPIVDAIVTGLTDKIAEVFPAGGGDAG
ncbi:hypothetical protein [Nitrosomonas eutropha]|uniref:hypothetical protein n=1 Tax=Nitrosomonas eutropha TaxID=916 RepID=UPI00140FF360|nr:hypothetical protein [Nitrosomonas eutropha]